MRKSNSEKTTLPTSLGHLLHSPICFKTLTNPLSLTLTLSLTTNTFYCCTPHPPFSSSFKASTRYTVVVVVVVMAAFLFTALLLAMAGHSSASWCVCKDGLNDAALQKTLDYACGAGADCNPTHQNGPCFQPNTVRSHCSYAVNSYFQKNHQQSTACDFSGTAVVSTSDPSTAGCSYPATASSSGTTTTTTTTPGATTPVTGTTGNSPGNTGILGGSNNGLGPSGMNSNNDFSDAGIRLSNTLILSSALLGSWALLFW